MDYENPRALPTGAPESNYGSSGSIAAKNHERKRPAEKAEETNLSGLSSVRMTRAERIQSPDTFTGFNELIKRIRVGKMRVNSEMYLSMPDMIKGLEQKAQRAARTIVSEETHVYACITIPSLQLATIFIL